MCVRVHKCSHAYVCVYAGAHEHLCTCVEVRGQPQAGFPRCHLPCYLRQVVSLAWSLPGRLG